MRGTYFVKHIKGTGNSSISKVVDAQLTRAHIANAVACSKAVSKVKEEVKEEKLWKEVRKNLLMGNQLEDAVE